MVFRYTNRWVVDLNTAVGEASLTVDSGAIYTCLSIKALSKLFNVKDTVSLNALTKSKSVVLNAINGNPIKLYPFIIPKVNVGGRFFPEFHCLISDNEKFDSVLGRDVLCCGITTLQFKTLGKCSPFDYGLYKSNYEKKPCNKLDFLDYGPEE